MVRTSDARHLARFASMQCYYNLLYRENEREVLPMCRAEGIAVIPYSPLARGFVAGNR
jgi:aryl-alcohol dehydrogenase-like predicted oxidoreductase